MSTKTTKGITTKNIAVTGMLSAVAFVLMYIEIAIPIMPSFIKFDFSDLPALLGAYALGPVYGVIIALIKNVLHLAVSQSMFVGELSNFLLAAALVIPAGIIYKKKRTQKMALIGGIVGVVIMGAFSIVSNYFIVYPVYYNFMPEETIVEAYSVISRAITGKEMNDILSCLIIFNVPFTMIKGFISVLIANFVFKFR